MFHIVRAVKADAEATTEVILQAQGGAPVHDLANACAAAAWTPLKQVGLEIAERTGVRIQPEILDLNAQVENWKHLRAVADERNRLEHEELRRLAEANEGSYPLEAYKTALRLRRILSGDYVREATKAGT
jgi:hypothetical protein